MTNWGGIAAGARRRSLYLPQGTLGCRSARALLDTIGGHQPAEFNTSKIQNQKSKILHPHKSPFADFLEVSYWEFGERNPKALEEGDISIASGGAALAA